MKIEAIDKHMSIEHHGATYANHDGLIDVPDSVGAKFVNESHNGKREFCSKYTKSYSMGSRLTDEQWNGMFGKGR